MPSIQKSYNKKKKKILANAVSMFRDIEQAQLDFPSVTPSITQLETVLDIRVSRIFKRRKAKFEVKSIDCRNSKLFKKRMNKTFSHMKFG